MCDTVGMYCKILSYWVFAGDSVHDVERSSCIEGSIVSITSLCDSESCYVQKLSHGKLPKFYRILKFIPCQRQLDD